MSHNATSGQQRPPSGRSTPRSLTPRRGVNDSVKDAPRRTPRGAQLNSHPVEGEDDTCVRVAVRARPLVAKERMEGSRMCITADTANSRITLGNSRIFTFDHVFGPTSEQADVYDRCVAPLLDGCFAGYNATVLAYGQTGSGKTYTMGTTCNAGLPAKDLGIIPRTIRKLFDGIEEMSAEASFMVRCQFLEIYNETIRDLLRPDTSASALQIRERQDGEIYVAGAKEELAMSYDDCLRLLDIGTVSRVTGDTDMNQQSSRSHAIFTILLQQQPRSSSGEVTTAKVRVL